MADAINSMADRWRGERRDMERRMSDGRRRRLREKLDSTHEDLEREREARRALAEVLEKIDHRRRSRGFLRLVIVGGAAYLLGSRAGRERYDQIMAKVGEARQSLMQRMQDMRSKAMEQAQDVRSKAMEQAQKVPEAVTEAAQSLRTGDQGGSGSSSGQQGTSRQGSSSSRQQGSRGASGPTPATQGIGAGTSASTIGHTPTPSTGSTGSGTTTSTRSEDV